MRARVDISVPVRRRSSGPTAEQVAAGGLATVAQLRKLYPECEAYINVLDNGDGTCTIRKPDWTAGRVMKSVPKVGPVVLSFIPSGATVMVRFDRVDRHRPRIVAWGRGPVLREIGTIVIHANPGVDSGRTGQNLYAGPPAGWGLDPGWQSGILGDDVGAGPADLVAAYIDGQAVGWTACRLLATTTHRTTAFSLDTGEILWQKDTELSPIATSHVIFDDQHDEIILSGFGPNLQRLNARTGEAIGGVAYLPELSRDGTAPYNLVLLGDGTRMGGPVPWAYPDPFTSTRAQIYTRPPDGNWTTDYTILLRRGTPPYQSPAYGVGSGVSGSFRAANQAIIQMEDRDQQADGITVRPGLMAFNPSTKKVAWTWDLLREIGANLTTDTGSFYPTGALTRDSKGNIYLIWRHKRNVNDYRSWVISVDWQGRTRWKTWLDSADPTTGLQFTPPFGHGLGILQNRVLVQVTPNGGAPYHPALLDAANGSILLAGPDNWRWTGVPSWGPDWIYGLAENLVGGDIRYHIADMQFASLSHVDQGSIQHSESDLPVGGPVLLFGGYIYGSHWDGAAWRIRRWN